MKKVTCKKIELYCAFILFLLVFQGILEFYFGLFRLLDEIVALLLLFYSIYYVAKKKFVLPIEMAPLLIGMIIYNFFGWLSTGVFNYQGFLIAILSWFLSNKYYFSMVGCICIGLNDDSKVFLQIHQEG